jgi:4,5-DOPA dioxygenase extradiol
VTALDECPYAQALRTFAQSVQPRALAVVSAHWESHGGIFVTASGRPETMHDFGGFPRALYQLTYPAPGAPELARAIVDRLSASGFAASAHPTRGLDHGAWVPLRLAWPEAKIPTLQISLPRELGPNELLGLGRALASLRDQGVLLMGTGGIVHNLGAIAPDPGAPVDVRANAFDGWFASALEKLDIDALADYRQRAPEVSLAVPTPEHLHPAFVILGARMPADRVETIFQGFQHGSLSLRSFALRPG